MAGGLKRQYAKMSEELVLMRCLRDSNMPKFVFEDVPLFTGLINDLFPGKLGGFHDTYVRFLVVDVVYESFQWDSVPSSVF